MEVKGILTGNSNVVFSKTIKGGSANTITEAITNACEKVGEYLASSILQNIASDTNKIELKLRGMNYDDFEKLAHNLVKIRGVLNRYIRSFDENGHSIIDIESTEHSWQIVQKLKDMSEFDFAAEKVSRNKIILEKRS